jgi:hypothetical protein
MLVGALSLQRRRYSPPDAQLDLKMHIYTPLDDPESRQQRNMKYRNRDCSSKDWRGSATGVAPGRFSTLSDVNIIITTMKRE